MASYTIVINDECQPYRKPVSLTHKNREGFGPGSWNTVNGYCEVEANDCNNSGGVDISTHNARIYKALERESLTCSASANSCREYRGNFSANVRTVF